jgi:hypothetical protein
MNAAVKVLLSLHAAGTQVCVGLAWLAVLAG